MLAVITKHDTDVCWQHSSQHRIQLRNFVLFWQRSEVIGFNCVTTTKLSEQSDLVRVILYVLVPEFGIVIRNFIQFLNLQEQRESHIVHAERTASNECLLPIIRPKHLVIDDQFRTKVYHFDHHFARSGQLQRKQIQRAHGNHQTDNRKGC